MVTDISSALHICSGQASIREGGVRWAGELLPSPRGEWCGRAWISHADMVISPSAERTITWLSETSNSYLRIDNSLREAVRVLRVLPQDAALPEFWNIRRSSDGNGDLPGRPRTTIANWKLHACCMRRPIDNSSPSVILLLQPLRAKKWGCSPPLVTRPYSPDASPSLVNPLSSNFEVSKTIGSAEIWER